LAGSIFGSGLDSVLGGEDLGFEEVEVVVFLVVPPPVVVMTARGGLPVEGEEEEGFGVGFAAGFGSGFGAGAGGAGGVSSLPPPKILLKKPGLPWSVTSASAE